MGHLSISSNYPVWHTMVVMNTKAFPNWTLEQTSEEDSSIPITQVC